MSNLQLLAATALAVNDYNQIDCDELFEKLKYLRQFSIERALYMFRRFATHFDYIFYKFINKFMKLSCKCNKIKYTNKYVISFEKKIYLDSSLIIIDNITELIQLIKNEAIFLKIPNICIRNLLYELTSFKNDITRFFTNQSKKSVTFSTHY